MRGIKRWIAATLSLLLIVALALPALADDLTAKQKELEAIQEKMRQLDQRIGSYEKQVKSVGSELSRLDKEIDQADRQLNYLEDRLQTTQMEIASVEEELAEAEESLSFRSEMLKTRIRALYERGTVSYLEVLLNARSFTDLINRIGLLKRVVNQDVVVVESIKSEKALIEEHQAYLQGKRTEMNQIYRDTERQRSVKVSRQSDRQALQKQLLKEKAAAQEAYNDLEETSREIAKLIAQMQQANGGSPIGTGKYLWPTPGYTRITSQFGWRVHPIFGGNSFHGGIDIGAPSGAKIVAADSGKVLYSGWMSGYGQVIIIDHGKGVSTLYAHQSKLLVKNNDTVYAGQQIGKVGSTGWSTGPHLHFEVRVNGERVNPRNYVKP